MKEEIWQQRMLVSQAKEEANVFRRAL